MALYTYSFEDIEEYYLLCDCFVAFLRLQPMAACH